MSLAHAGDVVVTIKPLHSLVAAVMDGDGRSPLLLVDGKQSLHDFSLKPSQAKAIQDADLLFYISDDLEVFLARLLPTLAKGGRHVALAPLPGITKVPQRFIDDSGAHEHEHGHKEAKGKAPLDLHIWTSPTHARLMVLEIARMLSATYPEQRSLYFENARKIGIRLDALDKRLGTRLAPLQGKPFVVFHDASQYFENLYGLRAVGALTLHPEQGLSAGRVSEIRKRIQELGAVCVFREPQFEGKIVDNLLEGTTAKSGMLDAEGAQLTPGKELYFEMLEGMAESLEACLKQ